MAFGEQELAGLWDQPVRRDARVIAAPLPSAAPIGHAAAQPPAVHRGRLIAGFAAVLVIGLSATTASILTPGASVVGSMAAAEAGALNHTEAALSGGERGGPHDTGRGGAGQADDDEQTDPDETPPEDADASPVPEVDAQTPDAGTDSPGEDSPGTDPPGAGTTDPSTSTPPDSGTVNPAPAPSTPPAQAPPAPAPAPAPAAPDPPAPQPAAPEPLAFTGLTENRTTLLGITLLSSYTLSLSGEPGAKASVTYGALPAGSVTFDGSGRATLKIGESLLGIELSNPIIRAKYTDGTAGAAVEARRDSI